MQDEASTERTRLAPPTDVQLTRESWRIFQIMAEFVEGFERLAQIRPSVSFFGSARTPRDHPHYRLAEETARLLSDSGFSIVSGGGPGIMEAANKGAFAGRSPKDPANGCATRVPRRGRSRDGRRVRLVRSPLRRRPDVDVGPATP